MAMFDMLAMESRLVWLEDPAQFEYVRVGWTGSRRKRGRPGGTKPLRMVGYAELKPEAKGWHKRRFFYVKECDRQDSPNGVYRIGCPIEARDPLTLEAGCPGKKNERAWGGKLPREVWDEEHDEAREARRIANLGQV